MSYSLDILEYGRLLELVARNAQTPMGRRRLMDLLPLDSRPELDNVLNSMNEAMFLSEERQVTWSFSGLEDPTPALAILRIQNASLEPNLLLEIARACRGRGPAAGCLELSKEPCSRGQPQDNAAYISSGTAKNHNCRTPPAGTTHSRS